MKLKIFRKTDKDSIRLLVGNFSDYHLRYKYLTERIQEKAFFFAEPCVVGDIILWRTPLKGKIMSYKEMSKKEQDISMMQFEKSFNELFNNLNKSEEKKRKIKYYFTIPAQSDIYIVENATNKHIVITQWGCELDKGKRQSLNIKKFIDKNIKKQKEDKLRQNIKKIPEILTIPDNPNDFEFAMGKWKSSSNLVSTLTDEPVELFFEFDKQGKGKLTLAEESGNKCTAPLQLKLKKRTLYIEQLDIAKCKNNTQYVKYNMKCISDNNNVAKCTAETDNGDKIIEFSLKHLK